MEYNHVLSETAALDSRFKKLAFSDAREIDEAFQRITSAAGRDSPSSQLAQAPGKQAEDESDGAEAPAVECHKLLLFGCCLTKEQLGMQHEGIPQQIT